MNESNREDDNQDDYEYLSNFKDEENLEPAVSSQHEDARKFGDWTAIRKMGGGGFGLVYEAQRKLVTSLAPQLGALKITKVKEAGPRERELYRSEISSLLKLQGTVHVATLLDCGVKGNMPWIVSRLIQGQDLRRHLILNGPLPKAQWLKLADNLFKALRAAHNNLIVHRDITPANILLADGDDIFVLIDFGLAIMEDVFFDGAVGGARPLSANRDGAGTVPYQAPEQIQLEPSSDSDIFAAGVVLYEAATGINPWFQILGLTIEQAKLEQQSILKAICESEPTYAGLDDDQARFLKRLLNKDPLDRPSAEVALELVTAWQRTGTLDLGYYSTSFDLNMPTPDAEGSPEFMEVNMSAPQDRRSHYSNVEWFEEDLEVPEMEAPPSRGFSHSAGSDKDWSHVEKIIRNYFDELPSNDFSAVIAIKRMGSIGILGRAGEGRIGVDFKIEGSFTNWRALESALGDNVEVLDPYGRADLIIPEDGGIEFLCDKIVEVLKASFDEYPPEIRIY